jgi:hypothetical protein
LVLILTFITAALLTYVNKPWKTGIKNIRYYCIKLN